MATRPNRGEITARRPTGRGAAAQWTSAAVVAHLEALRNERNIAGMARFGIRPARPLGISIATLRPLARQLGRSHELSEALWASGWHEARILAAFVEEPGVMARRLMDDRIAGFDSWDLCDQWCLSVFWRTPFAWDKAHLWTRRRAEFAKRAGFALIAVLAVHDRTADNAAFRGALACVEREGDDERRYVSKAVNWALRQIGKRNRVLERAAIATALRMARRDSRAARWAAADALREFRKRAGMGDLESGRG